MQLENLCLFCNWASPELTWVEHGVRQHRGLQSPGHCEGTPPQSGSPHLNFHEGNKFTRIRGIFAVAGFSSLFLYLLSDSLFPSSLRLVTQFA